MGDSVWRQIRFKWCKGSLSSTRVFNLHSIRNSWSARVSVSAQHWEVLLTILAFHDLPSKLHYFIVCTVSVKSHRNLQHGWTSLVAQSQELRADSLIVALTLSELKIAAIHKMWPWSVLKVSSFWRTLLTFTPFTCMYSPFIVYLAFPCWFGSHFRWFN